MGHTEKDDTVIGNNVLIRSGTIIYSKVKIGKNLKTGQRALIRENFEVGGNTFIDTYAVFDGNCNVGNNVSSQIGAYINAFTPIEDNAFIGQPVVTADDKYSSGTKLIEPTIKKNVRIGANSTIVPGGISGERAVISSGIIATKGVAPGKTIVGNPNRILNREN
jgi:acetyltransferase-like isoleucine patch superfamily enzyme